MPSRTELANRALIRLGAARLSDLDTESRPEALVLRGLWDVTRDALLRAYPWNFAMRRASLAESSDAPAFGWDTAFPVPSDFLALFSIEQSPDYAFEGEKILTDAAAPLLIRYVARVETPATWDALFCDAFSCRLAFEACEAITDSGTKKEALRADFREIIGQAWATDAIENPPAPLPESGWIEARR